MKSAAGWPLVAFFFFGGLALALWDQTSWIGIGQIWMAVAVLVALVYLGASGKIGEKLGGKFSSGGAASEQLARLERLRQDGDLTDAEYQTQRERIISRV